MHWEAEQVIDAPLERVEAIALDPETCTSLPRFVKDMEHVEVLERHEENGVVSLATLYRPVFAPPRPFARRVTREMAQWIERSRWDRRTHRGTYEIEPNIPAEWRARFRSGGECWLEARGEGRTARMLRGEVVIDAGLLGRLAERYVLARVRAQFAGETALIASRV